MSGPCITQSDLRSIRAATEPAGFADAVRGLHSAEGYPLVFTAPLTPLARHAARVLAGPGFRSHYCRRRDSSYRLGGLCLIPSPAESSTSRSTIAVARRTARDLLPLHLDRRRGAGGMCLVTSRRGQQAEAGR